MRILRKILGWILVGAIVMIASFFLISVLKFQRPIQNDSENIDTHKQEQVIFFGLPARLKIPAIAVDAAVESLGVTVSGEMDIPKGPDNVAWFNLGTIPGENGSAVMAGHFGAWKNGQGSVFDNLHTLKVGDKILVEDEKGETVTFVVREIRNFDPKADATEVFISDDGKSHLNLVTCEGIWNKDSKSYSQRLVVFADKE
jgi:LPXTG-site transpeptidase (sortase) family protein